MNLQTGIYYFVFVIGYLMLGFYILPLYQYQINNDGTALISIANSINSFNLYHSINAYWGLPFSILLAFFLKLPLPHAIFTFKLLNLIISLIGLLSFAWLTNRVIQNSNIKILLKIIAVPIFLYFAFFILSTDLFKLTLFILYLNLISFLNSFNKRKIFLLGILMGLMALSKEYFLYYLIAHLMLITSIEFLIQKNKKILFSGLISLFILLFLISSWGIFLQWKYGKFMFGSRGIVNNGLTHPDFQEYPFMYKELFTPPNPYGYSAWDEPTLLELNYWNPLGTQKEQIHQFKILQYNVQLLNKFHVNFSILFYPVIFISLLCSILRWKTTLHNNRIFLYLIITALTFPLGYLAFSIESRYIWINYICGLLLAGILLSKFSSILKKQNHIGKALFFILAFLVLFSFAIESLKFLKNYRNIDHTYYDQAKILKRYNIQNANIAANDNWHPTLYISVYTNNKFYGLPKRDAVYSEVVKELKSNDIQYFLVWNGYRFKENFEKDFKKIQIQEISELNVYKIK